MNAASILPGTAPPVEEQVNQWARETVGQWSGICQRFLDRQHREIIEGNPSADERQGHRTALKWLLRMTRMIYATAADPDYPDKAIATEIHGRLIQLEHSWRMTQEQMPEVEAEQLLREVFPNER